MKKRKYCLVLASKSPRRFELLRYTGLSFKQVAANLEEKSDANSVFDVAIDLAREKGKSVFENLDQSVYKRRTPLVIGADTIVHFNGKIYGKPKSRGDAFNTLMELSNRTHEVITGVCLITGNKDSIKMERFYSKTLVTFNKISKIVLENYLDNANYLDKAGAYGIQEEGILFVSKVEGSVSNVIGLPIDLLMEKLKEFASLEEGMDNWQEAFT